MTVMSVHALAERPAVCLRSQRPADLVRAHQTGSYLLHASATTSPIARDRFLEQAVLVNLSVADRLALRYVGPWDPDTGPGSGRPARVGQGGARVRPRRRIRLPLLCRAHDHGRAEKRHFRDRGWTVRPPRRIQELQPRIQAASSALTQTLGRTPTRAEVAEYLAVDEASVAEALMADGCFTPTSLDSPVVSGAPTGSTWGAAVGQDDPALARVEAKMTLAPIFRSLCDRDRLVLRLRFVDELTQEEIGRIIGVTQMQVSRILSRIMHLARDELAG
jgi:RNA polymerase sigma-B factor